MNKQSSFMHWVSPNGQSFVVDVKGLPILHNSVFSRFCSCGGNVTIGLLSNEAYAAAESQWLIQHSGEEHHNVSRHEWLDSKLQEAA
jgi:hypothetical protein